jgi:hypothetical protein
MSWPANLPPALRRLLDHPWLGYALAVAGTAFAAWLRWALGRSVGEELPPYITFYPVIIFSALLGGAGAGLLATVLAAGTVDYLFLEPFGFGIESPAHRVGIVLFADALLRGMLATYPDFQAAKADVAITGRLPSVLGNEAGLTQCFSN